MEDERDQSDHCTNEDTVQSNVDSMATSSSQILSRLKRFNPPVWAQGLKNIPRFIIPLSLKNNQIKPWNLPDIPESFNVFMRREDTDGAVISGNKIRKLEFLLADAVSRKCKHVITCGGIQSNHCRITALAARELGMTPHLILRGDVKDVEEVGCEGNLLLDRLCGAQMYMVPKQSPYLTELKPRMEKLADALREKTGEDSYLIPLGGSNVVGVFGFLTVFDEIQSSVLDSGITDIVVTCGSGGTVAGLCIANHLTGSKVKVHAVTICDDANYFHNHVNETLQDVGLTGIRSEEILDIIDGYKGRGYGLSTEDELEFIMNVGATTGVILDPTYTGKAVRGMVLELQVNPDRFQGNRILFIHTVSLKYQIEVPLQSQRRC
uniref:D-cysteine desulfhydrase 1, mitochondrial isoform X1 n=3 Tax=Crassostrea virginica TaxID=6565 RepID=A0A8B8A8S3_CRAVI|nr:putative D-cysteine desulfhydrase 1, mitochondrial isoform X1 [Crassostrea virginica]